MPVRQLTLYDFLADFVPGTFFAVLIVLPLFVIGVVSTPLQIGVGGGFVLIVLSYLIGRSVHAVAGQDLVKRARKYVDGLVFWWEDFQNSVDREPITTEPKFPSYLRNPTDDPKMVDETIEAKLPELFADEFDELSEEGVRESLQELRRFGFSVVFDKSTLYQRYNIQETFYRNLWLVAVLGCLWFFIVRTVSCQGFLWTSTCRRGLLLGGVLLAFLSVLFDARRVQFKDRQVRALINDLYLYLSEDDEEE